MRANGLGAGALAGGFGYLAFARIEGEQGCLGYTRGWYHFQELDDGDETPTTIGASLLHA